MTMTTPSIIIYFFHPVYINETRLNNRNTSVFNALLITGLWEVQRSELMVLSHALLMSLETSLDRLQLNRDKWGACKEERTRNARPALHDTQTH